MQNILNKGFVYKGTCSSVYDEIS